MNFYSCIVTSLICLSNYTLKVLRTKIIETHIYNYVIVRKKPVETCIILNFPHDLHTIHMDVRCFPNNYVILRCIIKDSEKRLVLSASKKLENSANPSVAKAFAMRWGIQVAVELNLRRILVH